MMMTTQDITSTQTKTTTTGTTHDCACGTAVEPIYIYIEKGNNDLCFRSVWSKAYEQAC